MVNEKLNNFNQQADKIIHLLKCPTGFGNSAKIEYSKYPNQISDLVESYKECFSSNELSEEKIDKKLQEVYYYWEYDYHWAYGPIYKTREGVDNGNDGWVVHYFKDYYLEDILLNILDNLFGKISDLEKESKWITKDGKEREWIISEERRKEYKKMREDLKNLEKIDKASSPKCKAITDKISEILDNNNNYSEIGLLTGNKNYKELVGELKDNYNKFYKGLTDSEKAFVNHGFQRIYHELKAAYCSNLATLFGNNEEEKVNARKNSEALFDILDFFIKIAGAGEEKTHHELKKQLLEVKKIRNEWKEAIKREKYAILIASRGTMNYISRNMDKFLDRWDSEQVKELREPKSFEKQEKIINGVKWIGRSAALVGAILSYFDYSGVANSLTVALVFNEAIASYFEDKIKEKKKMWEVFDKDSKDFLDDYQELIRTIEPIKESSLGEESESFKELDKKVYEFLKEHDKDKNRRFDFSEWKEIEGEITKDLKDKWEERKKLLNDIVKTIRGVESEIVNYHWGEKGTKIEEKEHQGLSDAVADEIEVQIQIPSKGNN